MKKMIPVYLVVLLAAACTDAIAPKNEGSNPALSDNNAVAADGQSESEIIAPETDGLESAEGNQPTDSPLVAADPGVLLGSVTAETTTLPFTGKSVYAVRDPVAKRLVLLIDAKPVYDKSFRTVASYECTPCVGTDDPNCGTTSESKVVVIVFVHPDLLADSTTAVSTEGWPTSEVFNLEKSAVENPDSGATVGYKMGISIAQTAESITGGKTWGTFTFGAVALPAATGDTFSGVLDINFAEGKTYKAGISGKIFESPVQTVTKPDCSAGQYASATFAD